MTLGTHATGYVGIAFEATYGTYVPPTRFFPIKSESLSEQFDNQKRRVIRGIADNLGFVAGWSHVEGDIQLEMLSDVLPYFMHVMRMDVIKTGAGPYVYTGTPAHYGSSASLPVGKKGMSITIVKNEEIFGFTGCVVSQLEIGVDTGIPQLKATILGRRGASGALPTPTWLATDVPFGAGLYSVEVPTAAQVFDVADFTFTVNDNAEAQNRLMNNRYAQWVKFGQREVQLQMERDFSTRAELDAYKALTSQSITVTMTKTVTDNVSVIMPVAVIDSYDMDGLSDQGQATMHRLTYEGVYDPATSKSYSLVCKSITSIA